MAIPKNIFGKGGLTGKGDAPIISSPNNYMSQGFSYNKDLDGGWALRPDPDNDGDSKGNDTDKDGD